MSHLCCNNQSRVSALAICLYWPSSQGIKFISDPCFLILVNKRNKTSHLVPASVNFLVTLCYSCCVLDVWKRFAWSISPAWVDIMQTRCTAIAVYRWWSYCWKLDVSLNLDLASLIMPFRDKYTARFWYSQLSFCQEFKLICVFIYSTKSFFDIYIYRDNEIRQVFPMVKLRKKAAAEKKAAVPVVKKDYGTLKVWFCVE